MADKKRKPGFLDIVVILVVLAVIGGAVYYFSHNNVGKSATATEGQEVTYTVLLKDVNPDIENVAVIGDSVYSAESGAYIGKILEVERIPFTMDSYDESSGHMKTKEMEGKYNAMITIEATAVVSESETTVNGVPIMVSAELPIKTSTFGGEGYGIKLEEPNYD